MSFHQHPELPNGPQAQPASSSTQNVSTLSTTPQQRVDKHETPAPSHADKVPTTDAFQFQGSSWLVAKGKFSIRKPNGTVMEAEGIFAGRAQAATTVSEKSAAPQQQPGEHWLKRVFRDLRRPPPLANGYEQRSQDSRTTTRRHRTVEHHATRTP